MKIIVIKCSFFDVSCLCVFSNIIVFCFLVHTSKYKLCAFLHGIVSSYHCSLTSPTSSLTFPPSSLTRTPHLSFFIPHLTSLTPHLSPYPSSLLPHPLPLFPNLSSFLHHASSPHLISASSPS